MSHLLHQALHEQVFDVCPSVVAVVAREKDGEKIYVFLEPYFLLPWSSVYLDLDRCLRTRALPVSVCELFFVCGI